MLLAADGDSPQQKIPQNGHQQVEEICSFFSFLFSS
jgi:hypothetical protein